MQHPTSEARACLIEALRRQLAQVHRTWHRRTDRQAICSGWPPLDALLPEGGFPPGSLVEWLIPAHGVGALPVVFRSAAKAGEHGGVVVVLDRLGQFYPPAAVCSGVPAERLVLIRPNTATEELWALDQSLRSRAVAAAVAWPEKLEPHAYRRLQLAAEQGGGLGMLLRPATAGGACCWAEVRLRVEPIVSPSAGDRAVLPVISDRPPQASARRVRITVLRSRGLMGSSPFVEIEIDNALDHLRVSSQLADPTTARRASGA